MRAKTMKQSNSFEPQFIDPQEAFKKALLSGRLTKFPKAKHYAGNYMYMYTDESGKDRFKNINSRQFDV